MIGHILTGKALAAILTGAVATGGAAAVTVANPANSASQAASHARAATPAGPQNGPSGPQNGPSDETGAGNGQGPKISALAKSIPGGPGKGALISAEARGHGQAVSAAARKNAAGAAKPATPATPATRSSSAKPATPASPSPTPTHTP